MPPLETTTSALAAPFTNAARVDLSDVADDTALFSSGLVDSFAMVDLLVYLEQETGKKMNPEDISLDNLDSLSRILQFAAAQGA